MAKDRTQRVLETEMDCGVRAPFHCLYRRNGKLYIDPVYQVSTIEQAESRLLAAAKLLRWKIQLVEAYPVDQSINVRKLAAN